MEPGQITPAWAGKSSWTKAISTRTLDHPRVGGEKKAEAVFKRSGQGSPPHGRGKVSFFTYIDVCEGITPAWAGKSQRAANRNRHA